MRTLNDNPGNVRPERSTALVARELQRYNIDYAALSETRIPDFGTLTEKAGGYSFYWQGKPPSVKRESGVGFAIKTSIKLSELPIGHSDRIMTLRLSLCKLRFLHLISVYAPTMQHSDAIKEAFYEDLSSIIRAIPEGDKCIILGDFNARVGRDSTTWPSVLGSHGVGNANSNGHLLLSFCAENKLAITNSYFQLPNKLKTTWKHARSGHWHLIDFIITKARDIADFCITRVMRGADCWTDHRLLLSKVLLKIRKPANRNTKCQKVPKKFCVSKLKSDVIVAELQDHIADQLQENENSDWNALKTALLNSAETVLGHQKHRSKDWFDDNDEEIAVLLQERNSASGVRLKEVKQNIKNKLREMKDNWWKERAEETQQFADNGNTKGLFQSLKAVFGPRKSTSVPLLSSDGTKLLISPEDIKERWTEHFTQLLSETSTYDESVINNLPQRPVVDSLADVPTIEEAEKAIGQIKCNKSAGPDGIPPELFVYGGPVVVKHLHEIIVKIWTEEEIPPDLRDANIITIFKKNDRHNVSNYRGISLLAVAGKVIALIMLNRMREPIAESVLPESQCGFRRGRGTTDMIFALRQLMEKSREQNQQLYMTFVDFTKAFDLVNREALWVIVGKMGCPQKFINILRCLHDDMCVRIAVDGDLTRDIPYRNGVKQGCILAPTLFSLFAASLFMHAFSGDDIEGIYLRFRTDGSLFNLRRLQSHSKCSTILLREFQYADDCALVASSENCMQRIMSKFAAATESFGVTINTKKTEVMALVHSPITTPITVAGTPLAIVESFTYLGSTVTSDCKLDKELDNRIQCASTSFGRLYKRLWSSHDISTRTKISVYNAVILSALLYGAETWTLYRRHLTRLRCLQQRHLRAILRISYHQRVTNDDVLTRADTLDIETTLRKMQMRWAGHLARMSDDRIPKQLLLGELIHGKRAVGRPMLRWKDSLKDTFKQCSIPVNTWQDTALERCAWRNTIHDGLMYFDRTRRTNNALKRSRRHAAREKGTVGISCNYRCHYCDRTCASRIGLLSHERACNR